MCGIFGIVLSSKDNLFSLVINGLLQLQNRGYDSSGICAIQNNKFKLLI
jgi:glucosamine 6-phosphate synthetase-like amidotransferase/phosphosugar isomerase protein